MSDEPKTAPSPVLVTGEAMHDVDLTADALDRLARRAAAVAGMMRRGSASRVRLYRIEHGEVALLISSASPPQNVTG